VLASGGWPIPIAGSLVITADPGVVVSTVVTPID
jgi:hypothetical protein